MKVIGNTSFRESSIKKMSLKDFKDTYKTILTGQDLEEVYKKVTAPIPLKENYNKGDNLG